MTHNTPAVRSVHRITLQEASHLIDAGHAVTSYPLKGRVIVDGYKLRTASHAVCVAIKKRVKK